MAKKNSGFIGGLALGAVVTILIGSQITEYWLFGEGDSPTLQPEAGGMQLVETPAPAQIAQPQTEATVTPNPFVPGTLATATANLRIHADASRSALVLNLIVKGESVTITKVSGNYKSYPVENEGQSWVRVRAEDGLVGWVDTSNLKIQ